MSIQQKEILKFNDLEAILLRKRIKNLYIRVMPPDGVVQISAPLRVSERYILQFLESRYLWIVKQQKQIAQKPIWIKRRYEDGEEHFLWGSGYALRLQYAVKAKQVAVSESGEIVLHVSQRATQEERKNLLYSWYKKELLVVASDLLSQWEERMQLKSRKLTIRRMKTRWGTCNYRDKKICLNLELIKYPRRFLEYVIVHELAHLKERKHGVRFKALLSKYLPDWRRVDKELNHSVRMT